MADGDGTLSSLSAISQIIGRIDLQVWEHDGHGGRTQTFECCGTVQANLKGLEAAGDRHISWVWVRPGFKARLCDEEGATDRNKWGGGRGAGVCREFLSAQGDQFVGHDLNDLTSFIQLAEQGKDYDPIALVAWRDADKAPADSTFETFYEGTFRGDQGQLRRVGNDQIRAIIVTEGYKARLCTDEGDGVNGGGQCNEYFGGKANRLREGISFIKITKSIQGVDDPPFKPPIPAGPSVRVTFKSGTASTTGLIEVWDIRDFRRQVIVPANTDANACTETLQRLANNAEGLDVRRGGTTVRVYGQNAKVRITRINVEIKCFNADGAEEPCR